MGESRWSKGPGAWAMFCEKAVELVRELHRAAEGRLPAFNVRAGRGPPQGASLGLHNPERGGGVPMVLLRGYGKVVGRSVLWLPARAGIAPLSAPRRLSRPPPPGVLAAA